MKTKRLSLALLLAMVVSGCASNVEAVYPGSPTPAPTGVLIVRFTEPMTSVSVRVDGALVVEDEHTERVEVRGVPTGEREVTVAASESSRVRPVHRTEVVTVRPDQPVALLVATPPLSTGYWIRSAVGAVVTGAMVVFADAF